MNDRSRESQSTPTAEKPTSEKKIQSNRRNAAKSTGPRTAQGKSHSRLNALKHGILASQAVIATTEGVDERKAFEALVDGLALDFEPVGTFEHYLVQQIAACIWRQRRLLRFENRAAFQARDNRTFSRINSLKRGTEPRYFLENDSFPGFQVIEGAGLGLDLPSERDTMRLVRYEGMVERSLRNALARLEKYQALRKAKGGSIASDAEADAVILDTPEAIKRNQGPAVTQYGVNLTRITHEFDKEAREKAKRARKKAEGAKDGAQEGTEEGAEVEEEFEGLDLLESNETNPNNPGDMELLDLKRDALAKVHAVMELEDLVLPKRKFED